MMRAHIIDVSESSRLVAIAKIWTGRPSMIHWTKRNQSQIGAASRTINREERRTVVFIS